MEDILNQITTYILSWGPSIVSIISMICTVIVAIKKVAKSNDVNLQRTRELEDKMNVVLKENAELKIALRKTVNKIHHIRDNKHEEK